MDFYLLIPIMRPIDVADKRKKILNFLLEIRCVGIFGPVRICIQDNLCDCCLSPTQWRLVHVTLARMNAKSPAPLVCKYLSF